MTPWAAPLSYRVYSPLGIRCILVRGTGLDTWSPGRHPSRLAFHLSSSFHGVKASSPPTIPQTRPRHRGEFKMATVAARSDLPRASDSHPSFVPGRFNWVSFALGPAVFVQCSGLYTGTRCPTTSAFNGCLSCGLFFFILFP